MLHLRKKNERIFSTNWDEDQKIKDKIKRSKAFLVNEKNIALVTCEWESDMLRKAVIFVKLNKIVAAWMELFTDHHKAT